MRKGFFLLFVLALIGMALIPAAPARAQGAAATDVVVLKMRSSISFSSQLVIIRRDLKLTWVRAINRTAWVVRVPPGQTVDSLIAGLSTHPSVEYAEPDAIFTASAASDPTPPNDAYYGAQWNLGAFGGGSFGINALPAWTIAQGNRVNVAVLDTGCAFETTGPFQAAPDLDPNRIMPLTDWVNKTLYPDDDNGHGTFLCGLIGETINNGTGMAGIAPRCNLMPGKVLDGNGMGYASWVAAGIYEAVNRGAQVILLAANSQIGSRLVQEAINLAAAQRIPVICPAGNNGVNLDLHPEAATVYDNTVVVGATTKAGVRASYSNFGSRTQVVAPGGDARDPVWAESFGFSGAGSSGYSIGGDTAYAAMGTSIAAAHVAGVVALALSANHTLSDVIHTAHDLGAPGRDVIYGYGMVDAAAAVGYRAAASAGTSSTGTTSGPAPTPTVRYDVAVTQIQPSSASIIMNRTLSVSVTAANQSTVHEDFSVRLTDDTTGATIGQQSVSLDPGLQGSVTFSWSVQGPAGVHHLHATAIPAAAHTPETNTANNQVTLDVSVVAAPFELQMATYKLNGSDDSAATPSDSFPVGSPIGIKLTALDANLPVAGQPIHYVVRGGNGNVVTESDTTTGADGTVMVHLLRYFSAGGTGTYSVQASATRDSRSASQTKTFQVTTISRGVGL